MFSVFQNLDMYVPPSFRPTSQPHNLHLHAPPNFSAFESIDQLVKLCKAQKLAVAGISNYYTHDNYPEFIERCSVAGIAPIVGLEVITHDECLASSGVKINDPTNPGRMYLCGLCTHRITDPPPFVSRAMQEIRDSDSARIEQMISSVNMGIGSEIDCYLKVNEIKQSVADARGCSLEMIVLQERDIAQAIQERIFSNASRGRSSVEHMVNHILGTIPSDYAAATVQDVVRSSLLKSGKPAYVPESPIDFARGSRIIRESGGIVCYPMLLDGANPLTEFEADPDQLARKLLSRNIHAVQIIPRRNSLSTVMHYVSVMHQAGLLVTVGTEHNTREMISLVPSCKDEKPLGDFLWPFFWRGACVCFAHQVLSSQGQAGFVDENGNVVGNPEALARLGAYLISQIQST